MTTAADKLSRLLDLARAIHYQPPLPRELSIGDLQDFTRLHAEVLGLLDAGAKLEGVQHEREALRRQTRQQSQYLQRCFDDLRHAEALVEELRVERDAGREAARVVVGWMAKTFPDPDTQEFVAALRVVHPWLEEP